MHQEGMGSVTGKREVCGYWNPAQLWPAGHPLAGFDDQQWFKYLAEPTSVSHFFHFHVWCLNMTEPCGNCREKEALGVLRKELMGLWAFPEALAKIWTAG